MSHLQNHFIVIYYFIIIIIVIIVIVIILLSFYANRPYFKLQCVWIQNRIYGLLLKNNNCLLVLFKIVVFLVIALSWQRFLPHSMLIS